MLESSIDRNPILGNQQQKQRYQQIYHMESNLNDHLTGIVPPTPTQHNQSISDRITSYGYHPQSHSS